MQARTFFRVAVLLPLLILLAIWCWEPRIWQYGQDATSPFGIQALAFAKSWLLMGGGQYMLAATAVLYAMEQMRCRSQVQLLFALCPVIFFLVCCVFSLLGNWLVPVLGEDIEDMKRMEFGGVFLALATLTLGTIYVFVMSVMFIVLRRRQRVRARS
ncbi:MAG: hypothetical protein JWL63_2867 [Rhodocyclales bacterium]|nr:hypothetical protein [Rhodocyclales bacterium]